MSDLRHSSLCARIRESFTAFGQFEQIPFPGRFGSRGSRLSSNSRAHSSCMAGLIGIVQDSLFLVPCTGSPEMRIARLSGRRHHASHSPPPGYGNRCTPGIEPGRLHHMRTRRPRTRCLPECPRTVQRSAILASARALWFERSKSLSAHPDNDLTHLNDDSPSSHHVGKGCGQVLRKSFGPSRIRTDDQGIMSPLL